jgi:hypothetical protein
MSTALYLLPELEQQGPNDPAVMREVMNDVRSQGGPSMPSIGMNMNDPSVRTAIIAALLYVALNSGIVNTLLQANLPTLVSVGDSDMQTILIKAAVLGTGLYVFSKRV